MIEDLSNATAEEIKAEMEEVESVFKSLQSDLREKWEETTAFVKKTSEDMSLLAQREQELSDELKKREGK